MNENLFEVLRAFRLDTKPVSCEPYGCGHINVTYLAVTESGRRYILQKINNNTFRDVAGLMENITAVTEFLRTKTDDPRGVLTLVKTHDSASYLHAQDAYWRTYDFVEDSICLQLPETDEDFYQSAVGFGTFQQLLTDFPAAKLHETIPNFHNTPDRYRALLETLERDPMHRAAQVQPEIEFALARQAEMSAIQNALTAGELPLRVTHNDTKLNNVLLDAKTRKALCVIDLDTVMPGSSLYDFGDSIRFGAATAAEDEKDLSKMEMSLDRFRVFTRGLCPRLPRPDGKGAGTAANGSYDHDDGVRRPVPDGLSGWRPLFRCPPRRAEPRPRPHPVQARGGHGEKMGRDAENRSRRKGEVDLCCT